MTTNNRPFSRAKAFIRCHLPRPFQQHLRRIYYPWLLRRFDESRWPSFPVVSGLIRPGDHVVDAGANVGYVTRLLSRCVGPGGCVHSFEPVPDTFEILASNVHCLRLKNVRPYPFGLSDRNGPAAMAIPQYADGGENLYESRLAEKGAAPDERAVRVELRRLDDLLASNPGRIAFLKIDVEGHELQVVEGASETIRRHRPALLIEISGDPAEAGSPAHKLFALLGTWGYSPFCLAAGSLKPFAPGPVPGDIFFLGEAHRPFSQSQVG